MAGKKLKIDFMHLAISWGATIVILGAMFKILHLPGAQWWIGAGLSTEALLFFITGFNPPAKELPWERVYPELDDSWNGELPKVSARPVQQIGTPTSAALDKMLEDAKIGPELITSLGDGLRTFSDKVSTISHVADASLATNEFTNKVKMTTASFDNMGNAFESATKNLAEMANTNIDSKAYHEQVTNLGKNLAALNAVYELELQDSGAHLKSMNKFYQNISVTMENFNESMEDSKAFKEEVGKLSKNLSALNSIYGNMLSAMNQPRV